MDLSIIIVNWNSKDYLNKCISTVDSTTHGMDFETIVIDNASFDGCGELLKKKYPHVKFIQSKKNLGFAKSNNIAFNEAKGRVLLFLNPDTEISENALIKMVQFIDRMPDAGAVGCKLLNTDLTIQLECIQDFPNLLNQMINSDYWMKKTSRSRIWGKRALFNDETSHHIVDAISGACLMIKRSVFEKIGGWNTDFFMYSEDVDLCYQVRGTGLNNYLLNSVTIIHHGGGSSKDKPISTFSYIQMRESRLIFFKKHRGALYATIYKKLVMITGLIRVAIICLLLFKEHIKGGNKDRYEKSLMKWKAIVRWAFGLRPKRG